VDDVRPQPSVEYLCLDDVARSSLLPQDSDRVVGSDECVESVDALPRAQGGVRFSSKVFRLEGAVGRGAGERSV
jgi:hypothetical protein